GDQPFVWGGGSGTPEVFGLPGARRGRSARPGSGFICALWPMLSVPAMSGPSVWDDCPMLTAPGVKIAPWKYDDWFRVTPPIETIMNIDLSGVHALKSHVLPLYAATSWTVSQPQKTPPFASETVPGA